ncbi:FliA/WhiG family RNA polymerase sigma factor [bacterium]|nr:FliA/WhiG family RNA polymerase sigma factor [bacterium]
MNSDDLVREYAKTKDPKLREQAILKFAPIVKYVVGRMNLAVRSKAELEDIHSAGITGLIRALEDFDTSKDTKFKTYATWRVRGFILDYLREIDVVSRSDRGKLKELESAVATLTLRLNREPSYYEVASELGIEIRECHRILELAQLNYSVSIDQTYQTDGEEVVLSEIIADDKSVGPFEEVSNDDIRNRVKEAIFKLPERQRLIVLMYYHDEMTLLEIGKVLNLSESRISRLLGKAIITIRKEIKSQETQVFEHSEIS